MRNANRSVSQHNFAMVPRPDIPRSQFRMTRNLKTTFDAGYLIPIACEEVLPGDAFNMKTHVIGRMSTPVVPLMDNLFLDIFYFFVPCRLVWDNWEKFNGAQANPGDSTAFVIPQVVSPAGGFPKGNIEDYFGLPTTGQTLPGNTISVNALPFRAYNLIWNEWFRDQNLQNSVTVNTGNGPDASYALLRRGKRPDYFTVSLPFVQKGTAVSLPLGTTAPVIGNGGTLGLRDSGGTVRNISHKTGNDGVFTSTTPGANGNYTWSTNPASSGLVADLSAATAATINSLRQSFQVQKVLERDARGGTRYKELIRAHFGVTSPDARLDRPEYLGGGSTPINITPVEQTSGTGASGTTTPAGNLSAYATLATSMGWTQAFTEHGYIIGLANVRSTLTYQQGIQRKWSRSTRYDFYLPAFAMLGEQAVLNKEIYSDGSANDANTFGYQERWGEYRYTPSQITGKFRSSATGTLDYWHAAQNFASLPVLNSTFIQDTPPMTRILAAGSNADGAQFLCDMVFDIKAARPMSLYSVPGLVEHF